MSNPLPVISGGFLVQQLVDRSHELHTMENVFCVTAISGPTTSQVATYLAASYASHLMPIMGSDCTQKDTLVTPLDGTSATDRFTTASAGTTGGHSTGNAFPNELARVITWRTGHRGRSYRGRTFIAGASDDEVVNTEVRALTTTAVAALDSAATSFLADFQLSTGFEYRLNVLSRRHGFATVITSASANPNMCNQRRRYERVAHR